MSFSASLHHTHYQAHLGPSPRVSLSTSFHQTHDQAHQGPSPMVWLSTSLHHKHRLLHTFFWKIITANMHLFSPRVNHLLPSSHYTLQPPNVMLLNCSMQHISENTSFAVKYLKQFSSNSSPPSNIIIIIIVSFLTGEARRKQGLFRLAKKAHTI